MNGMRVSRIVKGRATDQLEGELTAHDANGAYDAVVPRVFFCRLNRHEIGDLTDAIEREKACDQDIRFWEIVLFLRQLESEEHTSELQSHSDLVCRLLLEKKKKHKKNKKQIANIK